MTIGGIFMNRITLGKTGLVIEKNGFGCLPIQRISEQDAVKLLHKAYDGGINFFDTARAYSDSEQKVGAAFSSMRDKIVLATKTGAQTAEGFWKDLETSLRTLKTDYIDLYQFHNPAFCPKPGGEDGLYDAALEAKKQGKIRHISITNHRLAVAHEAIDSGLYETLQFPFSYLAGEQEMELVRKCRETNMGFIAMKGMAGGLIRDGANKELDELRAVQSGGKGMLLRLADVSTRLKAGRDFVKMSEGERLLPPVTLSVSAIEAGAKLACLSSSGRLLAFPLSEIRFVASGGKGVALMLLDQGEELISIAVTDDRGVIISGVGRGGKAREAQLSVRVYQAHIMHRARRGKTLEISWKAERIEALPPVSSDPQQTSGSGESGSAGLKLEVVDEAPTLL